MDLHAENRELVPTLQTERLTLQALTSADLEDVVRLVGNYDVSKMLVPVAHPYTHAHAQEFLQLDKDGALDALWMIHDAAGLCGAVSIGDELGYWLGQPAWGKGYMTEAATAAVSHYFDTRDVAQIQSSYFVGNDASRRVLEKLGFKDVGAQVRFSAARQANVLARGMRSTREDWDMARG